MYNMNNETMDAGEMSEWIPDIIITQVTGANTGRCIISCEWSTSTTH